jgi:hypothetical protein
MTWTTPFTAVDGVDITAAQWNASIRDNFNETMPGKASGIDPSSGLSKPAHFVVDGAHEISERWLQSGTVDSVGNTTSTSYNVPSGTAGPDVPAFCGLYALVTVGSAAVSSNAAGFAYATFDIDGDGGGDERSVTIQGTNDIRAGFTSLIGTTPNVYNTFKMLFRTSNGAYTASFSKRHLVIVPY